MRRHEPNYQMVLDAGYVDTASVAKEINWTAVVDYLFLKAPDVGVPKFRTCDELINGVRVSDHEPAYIEFLL